MALSPSRVREEVKKSMDSLPFPRTNDPAEAAAILTGLQEKKDAGILCLYPGCLNPRQPSTGKSGRRKGYCSLEEHNISTAFQERQRLKALIEGAAQDSSSTAGMSSPATLKGSVINHILHLQEEMPQYVTALRKIGDPDLVLSQIQEIEDQANVRIAESDGRVSREMSLRLAAEKAQGVAESEAREARETAEAAIGAMEEAEERARLQEQEAQRRITEIQAEKDLAITQMQDAVRRQIEETQRQAEEAIAQAQAATNVALEQARDADMRSNATETAARERVAAAERLVKEANANQERERAEAHTQMERLQSDLTDTRRLVETERTEARNEMGRLRQELTEARNLADAERGDARTNLERERKEVDRLRQELTEAHQQRKQVTSRADRLAEVADELREKLVLIQTKEKGESQQQ